MGLSWRKSVKLVPGVRLTFSKRGASLSAGPPHVKAGTDTRGTRRASVWRNFKTLVGSGLALRRAEKRMEGRCPPHRVKPPGLFCLDCGKYPEQRRGARPKKSKREKLSG